MFGFKSHEKRKNITYYVLDSYKVHKNVTGVFFFVASTICSTKQISKSFPNLFSHIYSQIEKLNCQILNKLQ